MGYLRTACGVLAALAAFEVALRPFFGGFNVGRYYEIHQYAEGISVSRYVPADPPPLYWRVTGNDPIEGAPNVLIVGDSYVAARQVRDEATMGSLIERWSRRGEFPLNVRQYGMASGAAPAYAGFAERLLARWNPAWVVVVIADNDLSEAPLTEAVYWRMRILPDDSVELFEVNETATSSRTSALATVWDEVRRRFTLAQVLDLRWQRMTARQQLEASRVRVPAGVDPQVAKVPRASIAILKKAYGARLLVVHLPEVTAHTDREPTPEEVQLERACLAESVPYASCREDLMRMRDRFVYSRGFHNTLPFAGHLNETGHRAVADVIWRLLEDVRRKEHVAARLPPGE